MYTGKEVKEVFSSYFNKILTGTQQEKSMVEVKAIKDKLVFTVIQNGLYISRTLIGIEQEFNSLFFNYKSLYKVMSKPKSNDEVTIVKKDNSLKITIKYAGGDIPEEDFIIETVNSSESIKITEELKGIKDIYLTDNVEKLDEFICETEEFNVRKCIDVNNVFAAKGNMTYNSNLFCNLKDNFLNLYSTNDIAMVFSKIELNNLKTNKEVSFAISNSHIGFMIKWINNTNDISLKILVYNKFIILKFENDILIINNVHCVNLDVIVSKFEEMNNINLDIHPINKIEYIKSDILAKSKSLDKEDNLLILDDILLNDKYKNICINKKLFTSLINLELNESYIGIIENEFYPILITNNEEWVTNKIICNRINYK